MDAGEDVAGAEDLAQRRRLEEERRRFWDRRAGDPLADAQSLGVVRTIQLPVSREDLLRAVDQARLQGDAGGFDP